MAYAATDKDGRMIQWSYEPLDGLEVEFSNGEYVDKNCVDGLNDFIILDGVALYSPLPENEAARLKKKLEATDYVAAKIAEGAATREEYAGLIAQRQAWRDRINALGY